MQRSLYALGLLFLSACHSTVESPKENVSATTVNNMAEAPVDTGMMMLDAPPEELQLIPDTVHILGDFDGDFRQDTGYGVFYAKRGREGNGEEVESNMEYQYIVRFSAADIRAMPVITGRHIRLVNEGDLNGDGKDEISVFEQSMRACTYTVSTWSYSDGRWLRISDYWYIPTACEYISDEDLEKRIVLEDGTVYYYETDVNDSDFPLVRKELRLLRS
ncbi:hypothetical protein SAMN05428949_4745 [Chitinophaga sp. YR627]|uniref:hypothetical protein n=1 Tax=Chitinophaga sp. YR627 TaxID=1881041 RepID=UPI0008F157CD|nr:hypothetical protein [Chitinophaga sp. YR627]SFO27418.1 hypothetical protein SAMN05428949_4745 [Chitinophaga sp. YR627]